MTAGSYTSAVNCKLSLYFDNHRVEWLGPGLGRTARGRTGRDMS